MLIWSQIRDILNQASPEFLAKPAAAGAHPDELFPLFAFVPLSAPAALAYLSEGELHLAAVDADNQFLSTVRTCRICQCSELDCSGCVERTGTPCHWVEADLCSACVAPATTSPRAQPTLKTSLVNALASIS